MRQSCRTCVNNLCYELKSVTAIFLIPGMLGRVDGRQIWYDHQSASQQQYSSFEELQRLAENPFENNTSVNVTVPLGDTAFLRCKVRNLGERSVSNYSHISIPWYISDEATRSRATLKLKFKIPKRCLQWWNLLEPANTTHITEATLLPKKVPSYAALI